MSEYRLQKFVDGDGDPPDASDVRAVLEKLASLNEDLANMTKERNAIRKQAQIDTEGALATVKIIAEKLKRIQLGVQQILEVRDSLPRVVVLVLEGIRHELGES